MREIDIVERIRKMGSAGASRSVIRGIGDDCAIIRPRSNEDLVFTTDFVIDGRHFILNRSSASDIGHIALARSLSDLAAMGSEPMFCLVSLAVPGELTGRWLHGFYKGLLKLASEHKVALAGGDLSRFDKVIADVMCCGRVPKGKAMLRSAAKPGDGIYVTGELGRVGLPQPRVREGVALRRAGVKAAIDISDGLIIDLHRMCKESGVSADLDDLPFDNMALYRGEDYELLFTARAGKFKGIRIGTIASGKNGEIRLRGKRLRVKGWDHFDASK